VEHVAFLAMISVDGPPVHDYVRCRAAATRFVRRAAFFFFLAAASFLVAAASLVLDLRYCRVNPFPAFIATAVSFLVRQFS
jgi:hypothetical protein